MSYRPVITQFRSLIPVLHLWIHKAAKFLMKRRSLRSTSWCSRGGLVLTRHQWHLTIVWTRFIRLFFSARLWFSFTGSQSGWSSLSLGTRVSDLSHWHQQETSLIRCSVLSSSLRVQICHFKTQGTLLGQSLLWRTLRNRHFLSDPYFLNWYLSFNLLWRCIGCRKLLLWWRWPWGHLLHD